MTAATAPTMVPNLLAKRYWPSQVVFVGPQSIAVVPTASTTWIVLPTRTGTAAGAVELEGKPSRVTAWVRNLPSAPSRVSLRYVAPDVRRTAYATAGLPAASRTLPAWPSAVPRAAVTRTLLRQSPFVVRRARTSRPSRRSSTTIDGRPRASSTIPATWVVPAGSAATRRLRQPSTRGRLAT